MDETRLDRAIIAIGKQTGASIGLRDPSLAHVRVHAIKGRMDAAEALAALLAGTEARARRIADDTFLIERAVAARRPTEVPQTTHLEPPPPEEIVVTASKRGTLLSQFPGTASVIDGAAFSLGEAALGTDGIANRVASLTSTHLGPGRNKLFIRGVADSSFTGPTQSTVGQYWGNARLTYSAPDPDLRLYDVASVEVLEGPQGTLYGAGSLGGIIRVEPMPPDLYDTGGGAWAAGLLTQHGDPGGDAGTVLNVPIAEGTAAFRGLVYGGIDGGYIDDRLRGRDDVNRVRTLGARGAVRVAVAPDWTIDLTGTFQSIKGDDAQYADRDGGLTRASAVAQPFRNDYLLGEFTVRGMIGDIRLVSATGISDQYVAETFDATTGDTPRAFSQTSKIRMVTSETRLSQRSDDGSGWLVGVSLLHNSARLNRKIGDVAMLAPAAGVRNKIDEATLFGEATIAPLPRLAISAGGRMTYSWLSGTAEDVPQTYAFRFDAEARASRGEWRALPSVSVRYNPLDDLLLYARYEEGYRPGGLSIDSDFIQRFDGDRIGTAEIGLRWGGAADGDIEIGASLAATRWDDIQADLIDGVGFPTTANIGDGRIHSAGVNATWRVTPALKLDASVYLNDSKVTAPAPVLIATMAPAFDGFAPNADALARKVADSLPNIAGVSARVGFDYGAEIGNGMLLRLSGYGRYVGKSRLGIGPRLDQPQGDLLDTGLELRIGGADRAVSLGVTNLFDTRANRFALGSPFLLDQADAVTPLRPRTIRLGIEMGF
ncbi:MAG TPA: TonB-dependent receptor [Sphingomonas sp.]|nr:TonB-dependent receptor [Sphingomonas sp.]